MNPSINERFIECVNETLSEKTTSKTDIAKNLKIGRTNLSEILNRRMNVSIDTLSAFCLLYGYDPIWMIFGEGTKEEKRPLNIDYKELAEAREEIIQGQKREITLLEENNAFQKEKIKQLEQEISALKKSGVTKNADKEVLQT
ncbi:helix-turn-helix domain-containing protein [Capnocytophaga sp. ARDL2]|uniref:helix-turn-helix domain-containing protein n=1 Tax=Capnocytophaga sp. ARDL2 TaxID=3238809 RepID=UPI0035587277